MTDRHPRLLSYSEIETALTCWARWDFAYGGRLAGSTLKPRGLAPALSDGRAWGAAVARWHQRSGTMFAEWEAHQALLESLEESARENRLRGWPVDQAAQLETANRLAAMLDHYMATAEQLPNLTRLEEEIVVPIPSRSGVRRSSKYRFLCFLDGFTDEDGVFWLVEFKLRGNLQPLRVIELSRQIRWYSWAVERHKGQTPFGVYVDQRLNEVPKPARINKGDKVSHKKDQITTSDLYVEACLDRGEQPHMDVVQSLDERIWQKRHPLIFRPGELEEAGQELVSAAKLIRDLDSGELYPIRNATKMNCGYCKFKDVCPEPGDSIHVESLFERTVPKRLREPKPKGVLLNG